LVVWWVGNILITASFSFTLKDFAVWKEQSVLHGEERESCFMERAGTGNIVCPIIYDIYPSSEPLVN
jgi:hypothetical protein